MSRNFAPGAFHLSYRKRTQWESLSLNVFIARFCCGTGVTAGGNAPGDGSSSRRGLDIDEGERMQLARKLLLTTEWIVEAGQKHGQVCATMRKGRGGGEGTVRQRAVVIRFTARYPTSVRKHNTRGPIAIARSRPSHSSFGGGLDRHLLISS